MIMNSFFVCSHELSITKSRFFKGVGHDTVEGRKDNVVANLCF